jgi:uncharacterized membrane-anchored protein
MRRYLVLLAICIQIAIMASVVVKREALLATDNTVVLRTAPVDPRDPFRGDFVILDYEVNAVDVSLANPLIAEEQGDVYRRVYASLKVDDSGLASVTKLDLSPPNDGLFLRGSVGGKFSWWPDVDSVRVKYGVEKLFVEQGKGLEMEARVGERDEWQQPMEVTLGVASDGTSGIKSWRWSDVALRLEVKEPGRQPNNQAPDEGLRASPLLTFSIQNKGDKPLAFYNPTNNCGFRLLHDNKRPVSLLNDECGGIEAADLDRVVIQVGDTKSWDLDMADPRWHVKIDDYQGEIGLLDRWRSYRIAYQPPENLENLSSDIPAWSSSVRSPSFFGSGIVD